MRKVAVVVLGTAAAFSPSPSSSALLPTQIALRAAEAPEEAAPPTEERPDAAAVAAGATAATAAGATMLSAAGTACAGGAWWFPDGWFLNEPGALLRALALWGRRHLNLLPSNLHLVEALLLARLLLLVKDRELL